MTVTLSVNDEKNTITKTSTVQFLNGRYWGVSASTTINSVLILSLSKEISESRNKTFTVNAITTNYIYYAYPKRLGTCKFSVGGFDGGFQASTVSMTNSKCYTEDYYVSKSTTQDRKSVV